MTTPTRYAFTCTPTDLDCIATAYGGDEDAWRNDNTAKCTTCGVFYYTPMGGQYEGAFRGAFDQQLWNDAGEAVCHRCADDYRDALADDHHSTWHVRGGHVVG